MIKVSVLKIPDLTKSFLIQTEASGIGTGAVLIQSGHPVAFFSKNFCPKLQRSSTYVCELHATAAVLQK